MIDTTEEKRNEHVEVVVEIVRIVIGATEVGVESVRRNGTEEEIVVAIEIEEIVVAIAKTVMIVSFEIVLMVNLFIFLSVTRRL